MNTYNFDKIINRKGTGALKTDALQERYGESNLIPLWVADMDFETPSFVVDAMKKRMEHPLFGYTINSADYWPTVVEWIWNHHAWKVQQEWLTYIPGIVKGIGMVINLFVKEEESVIIQPPVYHPFRLTAVGNGRKIAFFLNHYLLSGEYAPETMFYTRMYIFLHSSVRFLGDKVLSLTAKMK